MTQVKQISKKGKLILTGITALFVVIISILALTLENDVRFFTRFAALLGLVCAMISAILSNFPEKMLAIFGRNFIKMHHYFAIAGIILITLHPVALAIESLNLGVFIPNFSSWETFWRLAGRPSLYVFYIGIIAAILRSRMKKSWRGVHMILYIAILFAIVHATLIGTSFESPAILLIYYVLFAVVLATPFYKRWRLRQMKKKRAQQAAVKPPTV